jgi:hypothetical protein
MAFERMAASLVTGLAAPFAPTFLMRSCGATAHDRKTRSTWLKRTTST